MPLRTAAKLALYMQKPYLKEDVSAAVGLVCFANWVWIGFEDQRHALDEVEVEDRMRAAPTVMQHLSRIFCRCSDDACKVRVRAWREQGGLFSAMLSLGRCARRRSM